MDDSPSKDVIDFPSVPPGVLYDVGHQCRLQYGAYSAFCDDMDVSVGCVWGGGPPPQPAAPAGLGSSHTWCLGATMACGIRCGLGSQRPRSGFRVDPLPTLALGEPLTSQGRVIKGQTKPMLHGPGGERLKGRPSPC